MTTAIICSAILAALVFLLGANVTRLRVLTGKVGGSQLPQDPTSKLFIAVRAHGNAAEYVPSSLCCSCWSGPGVRGGLRSR